MTSREIFDVCYTTICLMILASDTVVSMTLSPIVIFIASTVVSMIGGYASLWRSDKEITTRVLISHALNMGTAGGASSMIIYATVSPIFPMEWLIIGFVGLISLMGIKIVDTLPKMALKYIQHLIPSLKTPTDGEQNEDQ